MDLGVTGARLASSVVMPVVKQLFRLEGAGAGLVEKPVRISALVSFTGERRTLSEGNLRKLVHALVRHADRNARPTGDGTAGEMNGTGSGSHVEPEAVTDALVHTLHALGDLTMEDVEAVRLGHNKLARVLYETGGGSRITRSLSADSTQLYGLVLESACLHILHFFTQRSTFIARTLVEQSRDLSDLIVRTDLLLERVPDRASKDAEFEQRYAEYVAKKHSSITIYGIDLNESREWPLDTAYLNLEAVTVGESFASHSHGSHIEEYGAYEWRQTPAQHVDSLLTSHKRVLLRGAAGSGKTTLIQWLAVSTALQERLSGHLVRLAGLVPFVLPLRTLTRRSASLPTPQDFLTSMGCPLSGSQPAGWADRVLGAGRGLLLVDGIDEVPERERERVRRWLCDLTAAFPGSRLVVTSRPSAVREYWLANEEFAEVSLSPDVSGGRGALHQSLARGRESGSGA